MKNKVIIALLAVSMVMTAGCGKTNTDSLISSVPETEDVAVSSVTTNAESEAAGETTSSVAPIITSQPVDPNAGLKTIGTVANTDTILTVRLVNATGKNITGLTVNNGANLLAEGDPFAVNEKRVLYYDSAEDIVAAAGNVVVYNMHVTFEDGTSYDLNSFPFGDTDEAEICLSDTAAYIRFTSKSQSQEISTQGTEEAIVAAAAAEAEAAAKAEAEQKAKEAAAASAAAAANKGSTTGSAGGSRHTYDDSNTYDGGGDADDGGTTYHDGGDTDDGGTAYDGEDTTDGGDTGDDGGTTDNGDDGGNTDDGCLDDGLTW
ncbi:MAG: hypothetical protein VZR02_07000 [Lachnospiraceae bacterium]|nr:hypothetical protein [Lachnospiraceae bacterium]